jgi:hypothetical protein
MYDVRDALDVTRDRLSTPLGRRRAVAYWVTTVILATECIVGGALGIIRWPPYLEIMRHLGYPVYLMTIVGLWYALAGFALVGPRLPRLKEWTYAGLVFNYTGAAASHLAVGDGFDRWGGPLIFAGFALASWALRPPARRLAPSGSPVATRRVEWFVAFVLVIVIVGITLVTLPEGPPPGYR